MGLFSIYYNKKTQQFEESWKLKIYSLILSISFLVFYPTSVLELLRDFDESERNFTEFARNLTYVANWVIGSLIYLSQLKIDMAVCNKFLKLYRTFQEFEDRSKVKKRKFTLELLKCVLKTLVIGAGFIFINHDKYGHVAIRTGQTIFQHFLYYFLYFPALMMTISSNRYYVGTTFTSCFIQKLTDHLKSTAEDLEKANKIQNPLKKFKTQRTLIKNLNFLTQIYSELHEICLEFNKFYTKNIFLILQFCFFNIVFELYFFYLNISSAIRFEIDVDVGFAIFVGFQIVFYFLEFYLTIEIYETLKEKAGMFGSILMRIPSEYDGMMERKVRNPFLSVFPVTMRIFLRSPGKSTSQSWEQC